MTYTIINTRAIIKNEKLKIIARLRDEHGRVSDAYMPERETAALIPRFVLLGDSKTAESNLLETIHAIAERMSDGRKVRVWEYNEKRYFAFLQWGAVRFLSKNDDQR